MLVRGLISALEHADSPVAVRAASWALETVTGVRVSDLIRKNTTISTSLSVSDPAGWYTENGYFRIAAALGGYSSYTGRSITSDSALESSAVYACVKIISEDVGSLPFFVNRRSRDRKSTSRDFAHPLHRTLHDLPNPDLSAGEFVEMLTSHAALGLDGFAQIQRVGQSVTLWPWMPQDVRTDRNSAKRLVYLHKEGNAAEKTYDRDEVFHLRGFTMDGQRSDPILQRARHSIGLTLACQEYAGRFFANDASPGVILERPLGAPGLDGEGVTLVKNAWKAWHQGLGKSHEPAVLTEGMVAKRLDPDHAKMQMLEQRRFQLLEVCRLYRMPPHKLAELDRATNNNIEHQAIEYIQHTLSMWLRRWRQAFYRCLLTVNEQLADELYGEHEVLALLRGDFSAQSEGFRKLLEKGVYSINEVRRLMNMNPVAGGDEHFIQLNLGTVQDVAAGATIGLGSVAATPKLQSVEGEKGYVNGHA